MNSNASAGIAGLVAKKVSHTPKFLPPQLAYFGSAAAAFFSARMGQKMKITVDNKEVFDGPVLNVFVANGSYSGAGMCWAPMAQVDDGIFEVVVAEPVPKRTLFLSGHRLYDGTFINMTGVHHFRGKSILIETLDDVYLELDGEQPGVAPMGCTVLHKVLNLVVGN